MLDRLHDLAAQRKSFAFETTLATRSYAGWLRQMRQEGYEVHLFFLWLRSVEVAIERVRERVRAGGHNVSVAVIRGRYRSGTKNFFTLYHQLVTTWAVYDHSVTSTPTLLAAGQRTLAETVFDAPLWQQFCEAGNGPSADRY